MRRGRRDVRSTDRWSPGTAQVCRIIARHGRHHMDCCQVSGFHLGTSAGNRDLHHNYCWVSPVVALAQMVTSLTVTPGSSIRKDGREKRCFTCSEPRKGDTL